MFSWGIIIALVVVLLLVLLFLTQEDSSLKAKATAMGADADDYSVIPDNQAALLGSSRNRPSYVSQNQHFVNLTQGFNISLLGEPNENVKPQTLRGTTYAVKTGDFLSMSPIPKMLVETETHVKAGDALFYDKTNPEVQYVAPVSGEVIEIIRGEKRAILGVTILADRETMEYKPFVAPNLATATREELIGFLLESGAWVAIRQRPYDVVADHKTQAKGIFISTFDTAPLAPNLEIALKGREAAFKAGLEVLAKLAPVHLGLNANKDEMTAYAQFELANVQKHWFRGQHPAGNVGIQIHHIDPINSGEAIWYLDVQAVMLIGNLFLKGIYDSEKLVAVVGTETTPRYVYAHQGISFESLGVNENGGKTRLVSGDPLSGKKASEKDYLGYFDDQVTTLQEGNYYELFGWLLPQKGHPTISRTFPGGFFPDSKYVADTNTNGEHRAFVVSGQYESVLPMDILPQYLFRAIQCNDLEQMEGLGILELSEEDVALCEYVCTSKQSLQILLRTGLDEMRKQNA